MITTIKCYAETRRELKLLAALLGSSMMDVLRDVVRKALGEALAKEGNNV